ncbi:AI-2E family transporter [Qingshengfaniella alkalisoli]|uniref:AI-2E family transporter n=1 Tax=Qingshengfaniella alkalisoli TaxID=2599296 RepID=A0A5B8IVR4_9RHOB|nr:AI-2E family transporter [Qingshengfaniella alkalisoli]QDY69563.1 AI-2E family transporter [Qingshengfaniella alkalisoli]
MALPVKTQLRIWLGFLVGLGLLLWALGDVLLPFILGAAIAYMLDPLADRLERIGLSRVASVAVISILFVLIFVVMTLAVIPTLINQATQLINIAPSVFVDLRDFLRERFPSLFVEDSPVNQTIASMGDTIRDKGLALLEGALSSAMSLFNIIFLLVVVPVVSFYLLIDWDRMVARIDELLPRDYAPTIRKLAREMDDTLASFIRGQGLVCLIQGTFYAVSLMAVGLNFGLVVGAIAGFVTFIPYVGSLVGGGLAIGLALFQFWGEPVMIAIVAGVFFAGQMLEGNVLTPKLVGSSVGLHPVWLLLALSVFGTTFGFVGMLVAVPVSAMIGVLVRFGLAQYKTGQLYQGHVGKEATLAARTFHSDDRADP